MYCVQIWASDYKTSRYWNVSREEHKTIRGLEHKSYVEKLRELILFSLEESLGKTYCSLYI